MKQLENKVAIVTGGGSGIGAATARLFAAEGAKVIVSDIHEDACLKVVQQITEAGGQAYAVRADVSDPRQCESLVAATLAQYHQLDIAFNNAGIGGESNPVADMSIDGWNKVISVNLSSVFYCMKYEIPALLANGGSIVNMASILGAVGFAGSAGYVAAKHGVIGLTQTSAIEYAAKGIRINAVGPGFIDTPLLSSAGMDTEMKQQLIALHPVGRLGKAEEVAALVLWLSTEKASFIQGAYYPIDGAYLCR
ncbi:short-chain dehydrogenase [Niabella ginsenosidivorans]|uniref:Short-chain dehydrogenase n=1 Tax=Niabella ginsenosidivorans TaxID=1176587 RepID=A0A1A9I2C7_9BACT|nr:SDR family oxidoreductase [Niabella ginsenosidivorans]ANH80842.1 short-chain dehydrogenase [Niabella ginsenosidivorans]